MGSGDPEQEYNITTELMFAGINMFFGPTQTHFSPSVARAKMSSEEEKYGKNNIIQCAVSMQRIFESQQGIVNKKIFTALQVNHI